MNTGTFLCALSDRLGGLAGERELKGAHKNLPVFNPYPIFERAPADLALFW